MKFLSDRTLILCQGWLILLLLLAVPLVMLVYNPILALLAAFVSLGLGFMRGEKLQKTPYLMMNGAGNRFVVIDARKNGRVHLSAGNIRLIANPQTGHGCDQLIILRPSKQADVFMQIYNADGGEVESCGNATRCAAWLLMEETQKNKVTVQTLGGMLACERAGDRQITVDMGEPRPGNATHALEGLQGGAEVNMGNPHVVFFVPDAEAVDLKHIGPLIENRTDLFPNRVNVSVAEVQGERIKLCVWERGAGLTMACGTAACATLVAAAQRGLTGRAADINMPGGTLRIEWREDGHIWMTGPVELEFKGSLAL